MSSFEKTKLKMIIANDIGSDIEDKLENEIRTAAELCGAAAALKQASKKIPEQLVALINREVEEGKIENIEDHELDRDRLVSKWVKKYLGRTGDFLGHLADVEQQKAITQGGRVDGIKQTMKFVEKMKQGEAEKLRQILDAARIQESSGADAIAPRTPAEAARLEHGTATERRAASKNVKSIENSKKKKAKKKKAKKKVT